MFLTAIALALAAPVSLPPVEQCRGDAEFSRLRQQVQKAVDKRDLHGLMALMSDDVRVSFGGQSGPERFSDFWTASVQDQDTGYALTAEQVAQSAASGVANADPVDTGDCAG